MDPRTFTDSPVSLHTLPHHVKIGLTSAIRSPLPDSICLPHSPPRYIIQMASPMAHSRGSNPSILRYTRWRPGKPNFARFPPLAALHNTQPSLLHLFYFMAALLGVCSSLLPRHRSDVFVPIRLCFGFRTTKPKKVVEGVALH